MKVTLRFVSISIYLSIHALRPTQIKDVLFSKYVWRYSATDSVHTPLPPPTGGSIPSPASAGRRSSLEIFVAAGGLHWRISGTGNPIIVERYYGIYNEIYNDIIITIMGFIMLSPWIIIMWLSWMMMHGEWWWTGGYSHPLWCQISDLIPYRSMLSGCLIRTGRGWISGANLQNDVFNMFQAF